MNDEAIIWVYVIRGSQGKYYTGITNDIARRMSEHRGGQSRSTKNYGDIELVWTKAMRDRKEARSMEVMIKKKGAKGWLKTYVGGSEERRKEEEKERREAREKEKEKGMQLSEGRMKEIGERRKEEEEEKRSKKGGQV